MAEGELMGIHKQVGSCQIANLVEIYDKYFPDKKDGVFVEVGAYDGYEFSNTWELAELGWTGRMYEPIGELALRCEGAHKDHNVTVICSAVGDFDGEIDISVGEDIFGPDATTDPSMINSEAFDVKYVSTVKVPIVTLNRDLPDEFWLHPLDLLVIDVEGSELQVLKGISLDLFQPRMMIVETHKGNGDVRRSVHAEEIDEYILARGYEEIQCDGLNSIYWRLPK
jgi:FkbM family methyltransferase